MPVAAKRVKFCKMRLHERVGALSDVAAPCQTDMHDPVVTKRDATLGLAAQRKRQADRAVGRGLRGHVGKTIEWGVHRLFHAQSGPKLFRYPQEFILKNLRLVTRAMDCNPY